MLPDYKKILESCKFRWSGIVHGYGPMDIAVIIPVSGKMEFNRILTAHFLDAIFYQGTSNNIPIKKISITFVEHSDEPQHEELCLYPVNYIHIPRNGAPFNKSLCHNIGALINHKAQNFLFHDVDILVPEDFFVKLYANLGNHDALQTFTKQRLLYAGESITAKILKEFNAEFNIYNEIKSLDLKAGDPGAQGGSMFVDKYFFFKTGGYNTFYTEYSVEDADFFRRIQLLGSLGFCNDPAIELIHLYHPIAYNQTTKDGDMEYYTSFWNQDIATQITRLGEDCAHLNKFK